MLAAPELLQTKDEPRAALVSRVAGGGATAFTLMTDFELGAVKVIPVPVHLMLDAASGALLAGAPWLLGYARGGTRYWLPHAFVGTSEVLAAAATETKPSYHKAKPELVDVFRGWLKAKRSLGWRRTGGGERTYGGAVGLAVGVFSAGTLILFLLRRTRGDARGEVQEAPEAASSGVEEYGTFSSTESEPQEAAESPANQEGAVEAQEGNAVTEDSMGELLTVVGVLAKMGEAFQETGGGPFILSSEDEGNLDLRGKESELDRVYQQQIRARVVGKIVDEDSQPRKMEVHEAEPA